MASTIEFKIAEDKAHLDITFPEATGGATPQILALNAQDVEALMGILGTCRAAMIPPRPSGDPLPGTKMISSQNMRWAVTSWGAAPYQISLCIFDRGFGWMSIGINRTEAQRLYHGLEQQIEHMTMVQ